MEYFYQAIILSVRYSFLILVLFCFLQSSPQSGENLFFDCRVVEKDARVDSINWQAYLNQNLQLDSLAQDTIPPGIYSISVMFIIGKNGCIDEVKIMADPGYGMGEKASKVISEYQQWIPAERNGRNVRAYRKQVVRIVIEKEECKESSAELIL